MLIAFLFFKLTEILLLFSMSSLLRTCIGLALSYLNVLSSLLLSSLCTSVLILLQAVSPSSRPGREPGGWGRGAVSGVHRVGPIQLFEVLLDPQARSLLKWAKPRVQVSLPASTCHPAGCPPFSATSHEDASTVQALGLQWLVTPACVLEFMETLWHLISS